MSSLVGGLGYCVSVGPGNAMFRCPVDCSVIFVHYSLAPGYSRIRGWWGGRVGQHSVTYPRDILATTRVGILIRVSVQPMTPSFLLVQVGVLPAGAVME